MQKEIVWSSDMAYAVGLITTDGSLSADGRHFDFTSNDRDLIETFKKCLNIRNKISTKRSGYTHKLSSLHIQFGNVTLYRWLVELGLMPNKSKRLGKLKIPDKFFFDFLRGHLDGDGSIKRYFDPVYPRSVRLYTVFLSASPAHIKWIKDKVQKLAGLSGFIRTVPRAHTVTFSKGNSIALFRHLYHKPNLPCLKRKFLIAKEFITSPR